MPTTISFDGAARVITVDSTDPLSEVGSVSIYSAWKRWVESGAGAQWVRAFSDSIGGQQISATQNVAGYVFLNNADGWRILPPDQDGELRITGNLYPVDPNAAVFTARPGRTMAPILDRAAAAQTSAGLAGDIAHQVWDAQTADHVVPGSFGRNLWVQLRNNFSAIWARR